MLSAPSTVFKNLFFPVPCRNVSLVMPSVPCTSFPIPDLGPQFLPCLSALHSGFSCLSSGYLGRPVLPHFKQWFELTKHRAVWGECCSVSGLRWYDLWGFKSANTISLYLRLKMTVCPAREGWKLQIDCSLFLYHHLRNHDSFLHSVIGCLVHCWHWAGC